MIAALLELFSGALVTMTGEDILNWLLAVSSGQKDWYTLLPLCLPHPLSTNESSLTSPVTSWAEFTCGWVHAATGTLSMLCYAMLIEHYDLLTSHSCYVMSCTVFHFDLPHFHSSPLPFLFSASAEYTRGFSASPRKH